MNKKWLAIIGWCLSICVAETSLAQLILNEGNAVSDTEGSGFLSTDLSKPYEGYDYGALAHSGNTTPPNSSSSPGNPFPPDVSAESGVQTGFVDGFDFNTNPRGFARIQYNGGEWIELVVSEDHADLRGFTFYWQDNFDDDGIRGEIQSQDGSLPENERGAVKFSQDPAWANLRAGTILTISEQAIAEEVRDNYPFGFPNSGLDDTGFDYDLATNLDFDPFDGNDDWHIHFHLDESVTLGSTPADTQYFAANSDIEISNEQWAGKILGPANNVISQVQDSSLTVFDMDVTTDARTDFVGEKASGVSPTFGDSVDGGGVGDDEAFALLSAPDSDETGAAYYEDVDWSTFGRPNLFNGRNDVNDTDEDGITEGDIVSGALQNEDTLSQVQDFSGMYDLVQSNTYDWKTGSSDFLAATSWELANDNTTPSGGPDSDWSARLTNDSGIAELATVSADATVKFVELSAESGTMQLDVESGATLNIAGDSQPGRVLVSGGGILSGEGIINADTVEMFAGVMQPGAGLSVTGDYVQQADAVLEIILDGFTEGQFGLLNVSGEASLAGELRITLADGFTPTGSATIDVLTATSLAQSLTLVGDTTGFSLQSDSTGLSLSFEGPSLAGDYNGDSIVNLADYTVWRDSLGATGVGLAADGNGNDAVDAGDYQVWKDNFGMTSSAAIANVSAARVPESTSVYCLTIALGGFALMRRSR